MRKTSSTDIMEVGAPSVVTLRGIEGPLRAALDAAATRRGLSLNSAILDLLRGAVGLAGEPELNHDLDALAGSWTPEDVEEFATGVTDFEQIDASLWHDEADLP